MPSPLPTIEHRRRAAHVGCAITLLALLLAGTTATPAGAATNFVIGDSNSLPGIGGTTSWAEEAFGTNQVNNAVGAASTGFYVDNCTPSCWWTAGVGRDDTFWIMLGTADLDHDENSGVHSYIDHMRAIFDQIPSDDIRLITSPRVTPLQAALNAQLDAQAFVDPLLCEENPRVTCASNPREFLQFPLHYRDGVHMNDQGHRLLSASLVTPEPATATLVALGLAVLARRSSHERRRASSASRG